LRQYTLPTIPSDDTGVDVCSVSSPGDDLIDRVGESAGEVLGGEIGACCDIPMATTGQSFAAPG